LNLQIARNHQAPCEVSNFNNALRIRQVCPQDGEMFSLLTGKTDRADTFAARLKRSRSEGKLRGAQEARAFRLASDKDFRRDQALDWINAVIKEGRRELQAQHALEGEVEAWDIACRIMFMVMIVR
jgi:hypothetical protein